MTPGELREVAKTMREFGIARIKMGDVEIILDHSEKKQAPVVESSQPVGPELDPEQQDIIQHKMEQMTSLLKLDDRELVDHLFPEKEEGT